MELTNTQKKFIATKKHQVKAWRTFLSAIPVILSVAEKYDGKVINKRFFDAVNAVIKDKFPAIRVSKAVYSSEHRIEMFGDSMDFRYCAESNGYIDENSFAIYPPAQSSQEYIDYNKRFNLAMFKEGIEYTNKLIQERIDETEQAINGFEGYMEMIKELQTYAQATLDKIPYPIRPRMTFEKRV